MFMMISFNTCHFSQVLRLMCAQSFCNNGLKPKVLEFYKREITQTYGFQHIITLTNLEKAGLLRPHVARNYQVIRKSLRLTVEDVNEQVGSLFCLCISSLAFKHDFSIGNVYVTGV